MNNERSPGNNRDGPPAVVAALITASAAVTRSVRAVLASLDLRVYMFLWAAGTAGIFLLILSTSIAQATGWEAVLQGIFVAVFTALLFAAGFGWLLMWGRGPRSATPAEDAAGVAELDSLLAPQLRELNAVRADVARQVKARSMSRIPLGMAGALALWILAQANDQPPEGFELVMWLILGAVAGEVWAFTKLQREYERLYKSRVLPALAARFGDLTYKHASPDDVHQLGAARILPECDSVRAEDEIAGTYRGLGIRIVEARLQHRSGDNDRTVFDGLLIEIMLPRRLTGTTAVLTDEGLFGNLKKRWQIDTMETVRLENPEFERRFEVYSDDQIEARALLTPAFMERFMALASTSGFSLPGALAEGNRLVIALPKTLGTGDLFEAPMYWTPAGGRPLVVLEKDIRAVLAMADTVVGLDFWAAGQR
jgi:hypothetical protein